MQQAVAPAASRASILEDFVDIFYAPTSVFERRRAANPWPTILIVSGLFLIASYIMYSLLAPVFEVQAARAAAMMAAQNPGISEQDLARMRSFTTIGFLVTAAVIVPATAVVAGLVLWILGKLFGAEQSYGAAMLVIALAFMPRVFEGILVSLQAFALDLNVLSSQFQVSLSPARFFDPETTPQAMLLLLSRLSPFVIWSYVLIAIGLRVTGRVDGGRAAMATLILWLLGAVPTVLPALLSGA